MNRAICGFLFVIFFTATNSICSFQKPFSKRDISNLIDQLGNEYFTEQNEAIEKLTKIGPDAVPPLIEALVHPHPNIRGNAAYTLGLIGPQAKAATTELINLFSDNHLTVRIRACNAIGKIRAKPEEVIPALMKALEDENYGVRTYAAQALGGYGGAAVGAIPTLLKMMQDDDYNVRISVKQAVIDIGENKPLAFVDAAEDPAIRENALNCLADFESVPPEAMSALFGYLQDENEDIRRSASRALTATGKPAIEELMKIVRKGDFDLSPPAKKTLSRIGADVIPVVIKEIEEYDYVHPLRPIPYSGILLEMGMDGADALISLFQSQNPDARFHAAYEYSWLTTDMYDKKTREQAIDRVREALGSENGLTRVWAASVFLESTRFNDPRALPIIMESLDNQDFEVRWDAIRILIYADAYGYELDYDAIRSKLIELLSDENWQVRANVPEALRRYQQDDNQTIPALTIALDDPHDEVRFEAAYALALISEPTEKIKSIVRETLNSQNPNYRDRALYAVHQIWPGKYAFDIFINAFDDEDRIVQSTAAYRISWLIRDGDISVYKIIPLLSSENTSVQSGIIRALRNLGAAAKPAIEKLEEIAKSSDDPTIRDKAQEAIEWIEDYSRLIQE